MLILPGDEGSITANMHVNTHTHIEWTYTQDLERICYPTGWEFKINMEYIQYSFPQSVIHILHDVSLMFVRKMIFSIKVFVTLLDYLKIPQFAILGAN
jgi:hypothetical protein